jgi:hypothetical protein
VGARLHGYRYHDRGGADVDFPLDALWADPNIDVVGIDAYFPLTDAPRAVHDKEAIAAGWAAGELIGYYYPTLADRDLGRRGLDPQRAPIGDGFWAIKDNRQRQPLDPPQYGGHRL